MAIPYTPSNWKIVQYIANGTVEDSYILGV